MSSEKQQKILELADQDEFKIGEKTFKFRKITSREFNQLERKKLDLRKEKDPDKASAMIDEIYRLSAKYYLDMSDADYDDTPVEDKLLVLEACNHRSMFGKPFLSKISTTTSGSAEKPST